MFKTIKYMARSVACLILIPTYLVAQIIKDEVTLVDEKVFTFQEVCRHLTKRKSPLISYESISTLDCMGEKVAIAKFCESKTQDDPYYIRAVASKEQKKVICKSAKRVHIKYLCKSAKDKFCQDKDLGCYLIQEKLAKRLKAAHVSVLQQDQGSRVLNCHFTPKMEVLDKNIDQI